METTTDQNQENQAVTVQNPVAVQQEPMTVPANNQGAGAAPTNEKLNQLHNSILSANVPQIVMIAISYALDLRSSDIHIEPQEAQVRIRYRVDGVLREIVEYPTNIHPAVVSRVKIMSNLKIDEQRLPAHC